MTRGRKHDSLLKRIAARTKVRPGEGAIFRGECEEDMRERGDEATAAALLAPISLPIAIVWSIITLIHDDWSARSKKRQRRKRRSHRQTVRWIEEN
jgi:hypothetical protein